MKPTRQHRWFAGIVLLTMVGTGIGFVLAQTETPLEGTTTRMGFVEVVNGREICMTEDELRYLVDPALLMAGGPPKDGIPSIDHPVFVSSHEADAWIADDELVLALIYEGVKRVYPLRILAWHEVVNDVVAGDPLLITYCPLCVSAAAYARQLDGEPVEFGTSGMLYNSNLVMYDRQTQTYWSQIDGLAIVGELSGQALASIAVETVRWSEWRTAHPDSEVLSQETGFDRDYGRDPYITYYANNSICFPVQGRDDRIPP